jgi:hypothetical protein
VLSTNTIHREGRSVVDNPSLMFFHRESRF